MLLHSLDLLYWLASSLLNEGRSALLRMWAAPASLALVWQSRRGYCCRHSRGHGSKAHLDSETLHLGVVLFWKSSIRSDQVRIIPTGALLLRRGNVSANTMIRNGWCWYDLAVGISCLDTHSYDVWQLISWLAKFISCFSVGTEVNACGKWQTCKFAVALLPHLRHRRILADTIDGILFNEFAQRLCHQEARWLKSLARMLVIKFQDLVESLFCNLRHCLAFINLYLFKCRLNAPDP